MIRVREGELIYTGKNIFITLKPIKKYSSNKEEL